MTTVIVMRNGDCTRCRGCGYVANTDDGESWRYWAELPLQSALAVTIGLVSPLACPACEGTGNNPGPSA